MKQLLIITKYKLLELKNILTRDKKRVIFFIVLIASPFTIMGSFAATYSIFKAASKLVSIDVLLNAFALSLFILFGFNASANLFVTMKTVFNSSFFETLAPLPINSFALFSSKIAEMIFHSYFDMVFSIPMIFCLAIMLGAGVKLFPVVALLLIIFEMLICFITLSIVLLFAKLLTKRKAELATWAMSVFFVISFILLQNYPSSILYKPDAKIRELFTLFESRAFEILPTKWILSIIHGLSTANYGSALCYFSALLSLFFVLMHLTLYLFKTCFQNGVESERSVECENKEFKATNYKKTHPVLALIKKEYISAIKNSQIIYSLLIMPAIFFIFTYLDVSFGNMGTLPFLIFTIYATGINSTMLCFGLEGNAIMIYKTLPVSINAIFWSKYLVYCSFNIISSLLCFSFALKFSKLPDGIAPGYIFAAIVFLACWLNLFITDFGFYFANFKSNGKLKDAVTIEGTLGLIVAVFAVIASIIYSFSIQNIAVLYITSLLILSAQGSIHYLALKRYRKGEF